MEVKMKIEEWRKEVGQDFPELVFPTEIALSVVCQLFIEDIVNPFALVIIDVASAGKTISLNFMSELNDIVYKLDDFTNASIVSQAANRKSEDLEKTDLLPQIKNKVLLVRDFSSLFSKREDELMTIIGRLTRVLD